MMLALSAWTVVICVVSQIPYQLVWRGLSTFPYDAFTTFNPWFVGQLAELRGGEGLLNLYQDEIPFDIWPSYFFSGVVRQAFFFLQSNSAVGHAMVQAVHSVLLVPATALLLRSFRVPWQYGVVGGLVFSISGIHLSLSQHVLAHEALLYLVLSLWGVRELVRGWPRQDLAARLGWLSFSGVVTVSLVRVHHEAILYLLPLAGWAAGHLLALNRAAGWPSAVRAGSSLFGLGVLVAVASAPMLVSAYELSLINKTLIVSYDQLGAYFSDPRVFFLSLVLPGFSGGNAPTMPLPFSFHQEATLSYVFFGTFTLPFLGVVLRTWWLEGRRAGAVVLATTFIVVLGYTMGAGSPIHLALCTLFPFLVKIAHNYYGFHLLYLLGAFAVAEGLRIVVERRSVTMLMALLLMQASVVLYFAWRATTDGGWNLDGSFDAFRAMLARDVRWHVALVAILAAAWIFTRLPIRGWRLPEHAAGSPVQRRGDAILLVALTVLVGADLVRPAVGAHFLPSATWVSWATSPLGGFNPSVEVRRFLNTQQASMDRPLRVLPIFPRGGGWQGNALMATDMHLVGTPGDSGGNRHVEAWLAMPPDPNRLIAFIDRFGVDAIWVSRWGVDDWGAAVNASGLMKVFSSPYGGDVYMRRPDAAPAPPVSGDGLPPWNSAIVDADGEQDLITRYWRFRANPQVAMHGDPRRWLPLPLMWHAGYGIESPNGEAIDYERDQSGRVVVRAEALRGGVIVRYPNVALAWFVAASALVYLGLVLALLCVAVRLLPRAWPAPGNRGVVAPA